MVRGILIGVLAYSLILTIFRIYKDSSSYQFPNELDFILAGPFCWLLLFFLFLFSPVIKMVMKKRKKTGGRPNDKSPAYIRKTVKKIMGIYKKNHKKHPYRQLFIPKQYRNHYDDYGDWIDGWDGLMVKHWSKEWINKKFERLMWYQPDETLKELLKYMEEVDVDEEDSIGEYNANCLKRDHVSVYVVKDAC